MKTLIISLIFLVSLSGILYAENKPDSSNIVEHDTLATASVSLQMLDNTLNIRIKNAEEAKFVIVIYDEANNILVMQKFPKPGMYKLSCSFSILPEGVYYLKVTKDGKPEICKTIRKLIHHEEIVFL